MTAVFHACAGETYPEYRDKETGKAISGEDADESVGAALHACFEVICLLTVGWCKRPC